MNTCVFARIVAFEKLLTAIVYGKDGKNVVVFQHSQRMDIARVLSSIIVGLGERLKQQTVDMSLVASVPCIVSPLILHHQLFR